MGDDFPKLIYHSIVCIDALVATKTDTGYEVRALGASHVGQLAGYVRFFAAG
jgi:3'-5' exonuclease